MFTQTKTNHWYSQTQITRMLDTSEFSLEKWRALIKSGNESAMSIKRNCLFLRHKSEVKLLQKLNTQHTFISILDEVGLSDEARDPLEDRICELYAEIANLQHDIQKLDAILAL